MNATTPASVDQLRDAIQSMDGLSQEGFSEISSIARLALFRLETPDGHRHMDIIAHALRAIHGKAETIKNCINCEAEHVGCNHIDQAAIRSLDAQCRETMEA